MSEAGTSRTEQAKESATTAARSAGDRLMDTPGEEFQRGYLDRYRGEDGEIDPDEVIDTGIDRLLFVADNISGGEKKSYLSHLIAAGVELYLGAMEES